MVAALAVALMAGSAYAAEWNFYGQVKLSTGWNDVDLIDEDEGNDPAYDTQYGEALYASSKIGANVKVSDELCARFEYGTDKGNANIRHIYGVWNFGSGTLLVGQSDTPMDVTYSNQFANAEDLGLGGYGDLDQGRHPELMLTFDNFSIALIAPEKDAWVANPTLANPTRDNLKLNSDAKKGFDDYSTEAVIPMIALCYKASFDMGEAQIAGGYNTFEINNDEDIDSYAIAFGTQLNFGAFGAFATFVWGENIGNLGATTANKETQGQAIYAGGEVYDCESIGGTIGVTYAVSDMLTLEAGYGYIHDEFDEKDADFTDIAQSYYLQAAITLAPGVMVTPEVGMMDQREKGQTEDLYFGAVWAISF